MLARPVRPGAPRLAPSLALLLTLLLASVSLTGCGSISGNLGDLTAISASSASVRVNQQLQIQSRMNVTAVPLTFFINGVQGGNAQLGTIDAAGLYTAPAQVPTPNTVTVTATANGHPEAAPGSVTVAVLNPIPVVTGVLPSGITEGVTTITVTGSQFVYGAQILWNGAPVATTYVSSTQVAAAITAPAPGTFPLLVSNPNPGSANSGTLNVPV
ncbi:MAG TPA: IPT/TIG domain-containing protein, partial [Acidobacteriaceae bacterium]|nr:IPT/TIG domain-containing protein [Acidobacteriaceae bacterium]